MRRLTRSRRVVAVFAVGVILGVGTASISRAARSDELPIQAASAVEAETVVLQLLTNTSGLDCIMRADGFFAELSEDHTAMRALDTLGAKAGWLVRDHLYAGSADQAVAAIGAQPPIVAVPGQQWIWDPRDSTRVIQMLRLTVNEREVWRFGNSMKAIPSADCVPTDD